MSLPHLRNGYARFAGRQCYRGIRIHRDAEIWRVVGMPREFLHSNLAVPPGIIVFGDMIEYPVLRTVGRLGERMMTRSVQTVTGLEYRLVAFAP